jgi:heme exporter protein B
MNDFARVAWLVVRKDIAVEVRSWELISTTVFFAFACVLVFAFAFVEEGRVVANVSAGILWIAIAFSGTLALARTFERERQTETLRALLLAPADRPALYLGKLVGILLLMGITELILLPLVWLFFQAPLWGSPVLLVALLVSGTVGYAAVGTLFAAMTAHLRARELLFPVLFLPMEVPVLLGTVQATEALFLGEPLSAVSHWLQLLLAADLVYVTAGILTFDFILEG